MEIDLLGVNISKQKLDKLLVFDNYILLGAGFRNY